MKTLAKINYDIIRAPPSGQLIFGCLGILIYNSLRYKELSTDYYANYSIVFNMICDDKNQVHSAIYKQT
jgi:hypothetical protein